MITTIYHLHTYTLYKRMFMAYVHMYVYESERHHVTCTAYMRTYVRSYLLHVDQSRTSGGSKVHSSVALRLLCQRLHEGCALQATRQTTVGATQRPHTNSRYVNGKMKQSMRTALVSQTTDRCIVSHTSSESHMHST